MTIGDDLPSLFAYTRWADARVVEAVRRLSPEQYVAQPAPGWDCLRATLVHTAGATRIWSRRLQGEAVTSWITQGRLPDPPRRRAGSFGEGHDAFDRLIADLTPERLETVFTYRNLAGDLFSLPLWSRLPPRRQPRDLSPGPGRLQAQAVRDRPAGYGPEHLGVRADPARLSRDGRLYGERPLGRLRRRPRERPGPRQCAGAGPWGRAGGFAAGGPRPCGGRQVEAPSWVWWASGSGVGRVRAWPTSRRKPFAASCAEAASKPGGWADLRERFRSLDLFVLEDMHALERAPLALAELTHTLDALADLGAAVAVSARSGPSRWEGWPVAAGQPADRRAGGAGRTPRPRLPPPLPPRPGSASQGLRLASDAVDSLAEAADGYRTLDGWLARLALSSRLEGRPPDLGLADSLLAEPGSAATPGERRHRRCRPGPSPSGSGSRSVTCVRPRDASRSPCPATSPCTWPGR